jgi:allophanate hydrolase
LNETLPLGDIRSLLGHYEEGRLTPSLVVETVHGAIQSDPDNIWISRLSLESLRSHARRVEALGMHALPLYGIPFAIKDNIDLAGVPTTAGCPAFSYTPAHSATVVRKLLGAGAIPIGKTNLDQFATGLNGTRSPYGSCRNASIPNIFPAVRVPAPQWRWRRVMSASALEPTPQGLAECRRHSIT